jgi:hypothetical protein
LTLDTTTAHAPDLEAAGMPAEAALDVAAIGSGFNAIVRIANDLQFRVPGWTAARTFGHVLLHLGYRYWCQWPPLSMRGFPAGRRARYRALVDRLLTDAVETPGFLTSAVRRDLCLGAAADFTSRTEDEEFELVVCSALGRMVECLRYSLDYDAAVIASPSPGPSGAQAIPSSIRI